MADIEYCKTWVSDKTLKKIASVLHLAPYQLLMPADENTDVSNDFARKVSDFADLSSLVEVKKNMLKKAVDEHLDALVSEIIESNR